jgi:hypothetical protein
MTKKRVFIILILASVVLLAGCYTKKRGIVPCPGHGYYDMKFNQPDRLALENA